ncbi:MAG: type II secretion system protein [Bacilli bacterium]|jgi:prepilin-type N-terminal cleavage/methylation domain-containing protein|nr:type II secretion system protein [Bacilli bacterium]
MKKGFTLLELLVVIAIMAVVTISATISFGGINDDTEAKELKNKYKEIQRSAIVFLDLNDSWLNQFNEKGFINIKIQELVNSNYVTDLQNPVTKEQISTDYTVKIFIKNPSSNPYVDSCIISGTTCIANSDGEQCQITDCN